MVIIKGMNAMSEAEEILESGKLMGLVVEGYNKESKENINKHL